MDQERITKVSHLAIDAGLKVGALGALLRGYEVSAASEPIDVSDYHGIGHILKDCAATIFHVEDLFTSIIQELIRGEES